MQKLMWHLFQDGKLLFNKKTILVFFLFLSSLSLWGVKIEFTNITTKSIPTQYTSNRQSYYQLTSEFYLENLQKKNYKLFLFNRKKYMLKNNYYLNGFLKTESSYLSFKKAYILGGYIYLFTVKGDINKINIKAQEVIFNKNRTYKLLKCEVKKDSSILRRKSYIIKENR